MILEYGLPTSSEKNTECRADESLNSFLEFKNIFTFSFRTILLILCLLESWPC